MVKIGAIACCQQCGKPNSRQKLLQVQKFGEPGPSASPAIKNIKDPSGILVKPCLKGFSAL